MHSTFFHGGPPHMMESAAGQMRNDGVLHEKYGAKTFRVGHSYSDIIIRDIQLLVIVFIAAFLIHAVFRTVYSQFFVRKATKAARPRKASSPVVDGTPLLSVHDNLAAQSMSAADLLEFSEANLDSFTLSNLVFAIYRAGKLHVKPCAAYTRLLEAVRPSVHKLKPRGAAHILWGIARVKPSGAETLVDELCVIVADKLTELRAVDVICSLWAAAELGQKGASPRLDKLLLASDVVTLEDFTPSERVSLLATLAGAQVDASGDWSGRSLVERVLQDVVQDTAVVSPTEQTKLIRAVCVLQNRDLAAEDVAQSIFKGVGGSTTDASTALQPRLEALAALPVTSAAARNARHVIARHTMESQFQDLTATDLVVLGTTMAVGGLPESGEFYLELAQALRPLELSAQQQRAVKQAFDSAGVGSLCDLS